MPYHAKRTPIIIKYKTMPIETTNTPPYYKKTGITKIYNAWISQSGTDDPELEIMKNTIGDIVWTRTDVGQYQGELTGAFPEGKVINFIQSKTTGRELTMYTDWPDKIILTTYAAGILSDNMLGNNSLTIQVNY